MALEEAKYRVVHQNEAYEIRLYDERLVAQVEYDGENSGFRTLFNFISGANTATTKIEMTTPVTQSIEIEMTTPVSQFSDSSGKVMQFFMPSKFTKETVPEPTNPAVKIKTVKGGHFAVVRYSGRASDKNFRKHSEALESELQKNGVRYIKPFLKATYDSPFTLPFLRRNEAMVRVEWD